MKKKLKIAYVTTYDAQDIKYWSGLGYFIGQTLQKYIGDVEYIGNLKTKIILPNFFKKIYAKIIEGKYFHSDRTQSCGRYYAEQVKQKIKRSHYDLIFSPSTLPIAYLDTDITKIFWADANWHAMLGYYFYNVSKMSIKDGDEMEMAALESCSLCIYSSHWAASTAIDYYKINPQKVIVIPFGANIKSVPDLAFHLRNNTMIKLLFVGRDWFRKGGDIALEIVKLINKNGVNAKLIVVGCVPALKDDDIDIVELIGHLDKNRDADQERLKNLYMNSDFFIMPSRQEAFGVVFCEASAFGLPLIGTNTGGIPTIIDHNKNGILLNLNKDEDLSKVAETITNIWMNDNLYIQMSMESRKKYETELNWDSAGKKLKTYIDRIL